MPPVDSVLWIIQSKKLTVSRNTAESCWWIFSYTSDMAEEMAELVNPPHIVGYKIV